MEPHLSKLPGSRPGITEYHHRGSRSISFVKGFSVIGSIWPMVGHSRHEHRRRRHRYYHCLGSRSI